jgi:hypothetical protein
MIARLAMGFALALIAATAVARSSPASDPQTLRTPASFDAIADRRARSQALFGEVGKVLQSPRCLNCHPRGDSPTQTDAMRPHAPVVMRGREGKGAPGLPCASCHHEANFDPARVPGAPHWALAPAAMAWQGLSLPQICRQLKDRHRNGDRTLAELEHHMAADALVGWAWNPGAGRTPAPGSQAQFGALFSAWVATGAVCPA